MCKITDMPERIWASVCARKIWDSEDHKLDADVEYVRGDRVRELKKALSMARDALDEISREDSRMDKASALAIADICRAQIANNE